MNETIKLLEKEYKKNPEIEIVFEKDENNNWAGKDIAYIRDTSVNYAKIISAEFFRQGDVVIIEHNNSIDDYCKLFAAWYVGGIPLLIYKELSPLTKNSIFEKVKSKYKSNVYNWQEITNTNYKDDTLMNNWEAESETNTSYLYVDPLKPEILKFSHMAIYNLTKSTAGSNELVTGKTYYVPAPIDEIFVLITGILASLHSKRKTYLSGSVESFNYVLNKPDSFLSIINAFKEINPSTIFYCDFFYNDVREYCLQLLGENSKIGKKQLREKVFGKNLQHAYITIYNQVKISSGLLEFFNKKLGITLQLFLCKTETPLCFINNKTEYIEGSIGKPVSSATDYKIIEDELCVKTDAMFSGYVDKTDNNITEDGFFKTNYLASEDKNGYVFLHGKKRSPLSV